MFFSPLKSKNLRWFARCKNMLFLHFSFVGDYTTIWHHSTSAGGSNTEDENEANKC